MGPGGVTQAGRRARLGLVGARGVVKSRAVGLDAGADLALLLGELRVLPFEELAQLREPGQTDRPSGITSKA